MTYENGQYNWSDELFNILEINKEDFDINNTNLIELFANEKTGLSINEIINSLHKDTFIESDFV